MTQKPKFSLEQFNAKHVIPTNLKNSIMGGTIVCIAGGVGAEGDTGGREVGGEV